MPLFNLSVGMCVHVCVTFVVFADCESCTRPISTNPGFMEAGEYGLTRVTFPRIPSRVGRGRRAAVDFVVCFGWGGGFFRVFFSSIFFSSKRTRPAASMRPPLASFTSLLVPGCVPVAILQLVCLSVYV